MKSKQVSESAVESDGEKWRILQATQLIIQAALRDFSELQRIYPADNHFRQIWGAVEALREQERQTNYLDSHELDEESYQALRKLSKRGDADPENIARELGVMGEDEPSAE